MEMSLSIIDTNECSQKKYGLKLKVVLKWRNIYTENLSTTNMPVLNWREFLNVVLNNRDCMWKDYQQIQQTKKKTTNFSLDTL